MSLRYVFSGLAAGCLFVPAPCALGEDTEPRPEQQDSTSSTHSTSQIRLPFLGSIKDDAEAEDNAASTAEIVADPLQTPPDIPADGAETAASAETLAEAPVILPPDPDLLAQSAIAYGSFQNDVTTLKIELESQADIATALDTLGTHNSESLAAGWLAYSALLASRSEAYEEGVLQAADAYGRERLLLGMRNDPTYALSIRGADDAMDLVLGATDSDARRLDVAGQYIREQAYSLQQLGWARARLPGLPADDARILREAAEIGRPEAQQIRDLFISSDVDSVLANASSLGGSSSLWDTVSAASAGLELPGIGEIQPAAPAPAYLPQGDYQIADDHRRTGGNIATLAALQILEETNSENEFLAAGLNDAQTQVCFETAHMNLLQCVSASRNVFERPFCIGVHALIDVGECVGSLTAE
ncbi:hypothetical protein [Ponticaulis sp.]|uniref:hypothetical protein n=1 Tax=Ponticaulis sp. TaxID=2020902 RepID=UPI000B6E5C63|nr:hypothetical protein [Ponticaulis sp.]MAI90320.1 hypothetical protein [Ponticaulis sp.]OUX99958.1 MAG: hypothetical protein CBB65_07760 [Hyphomonadaceae bacterium TMED5]|tara:strand:- start:296538 stop:297785 length:1248 start_codon:yes stop_codon:yes gene_type:complete